jgi:hypothetical protein
MIVLSQEGRSDMSLVDNVVKTGVIAVIGYTALKVADKTLSRLHKGIRKVRSARPVKKANLPFGDFRNIGL